MDESKKKLVLDTSVALKWLLKEDHGKEAAKIAQRLIDEKITISVPSHFYAEIANVLGRKDPGSATSFISVLKLSTIKERVFGVPLIHLALLLMNKYSKITFYDAAYHALALSENGTFITADEEYYKTTKKEGSIMLLKDYK